MSLDEREDPDEEQEIEVEGIPFVVNEDVIDSYGLNTRLPWTSTTCLRSVRNCRRPAPRRNPMALVPKRKPAPCHKRRQRFPLKSLVHPRATRRQIRRRPLLLVADRDFFELRGQAHTFYTAQDERVIPSVPHPTHEYNATDTKGGSPDESREPGRSRENL